MKKVLKVGKKVEKSGKNIWKNGWKNNLESVENDQENKNCIQHWLTGSNG